MSYSTVYFERRILKKTKKDRIKKKIPETIDKIKELEQFIEFTSSFMDSCIAFPIASYGILGVRQRRDVLLIDNYNVLRNQKCSAA
jgi:hypothetical protein